MVEPHRSFVLPEGPCLRWSQGARSASQGVARGFAALLNTLLGSSEVAPDLHISG